ncbi:MAG: Ig-like domain-containing protein, partial [Gammaproteobacteria bacterium]|nr:Ig-like domain-containing protein [Gammaproteobacteria bacterium]
MTLPTKRTYGRLLLVTLSALVLAACSGGSGSSGGDPAGGNRAPIAVTDIVEADGGALMIPVLSNDFDPDGDAIRLLLVNAPAHGTSVVDDAGTPADTTDDVVVYTPATGYTGADSFSYTVSDGFDGRANGDVQIMAIPALNALDKTVST